MKSATKPHENRIKVRFTSYSGGKSNFKNFAYIPTTIMNIKNGTAEFAQWNYRYAYTIRAYVSLVLTINEICRKPDENRIKVRFMPYSGGKSNLEKFAYLPTTIMNMKNGTTEFAHWNYRYAYTIRAYVSRS